MLFLRVYGADQGDGGGQVDRVKTQEDSSLNSAWSKQRTAIDKRDSITRQHSDLIQRFDSFLFSL
jgi:hypothetical protein